MPIYHLMLALVVVVIWGINFLFIKFALNETYPLLLCAIRFFLASVPAVFFFKRPAVPFKTLAAYGLTMFALQFSLIFIGMKVGMTPGMASLLMQVQVFFSMFFAAVLLNEWPSLRQIIGALVAFTGIGIVAMHLDSNVSLAGFICIMLAAISWGIGNLITKKMKGINMLSLVVWGSFVAAFPTLLVSLVFEGPSAMTYTIHHVTWMGLSSLAYIVCISTWVGYGIWNWLLSRYPVGVIVPFTLLVPIVGILSSVIVLHEPFQLWKCIAGILVISGLCINLLGARIFSTKRSIEMNTAWTKENT